MPPPLLERKLIVVTGKGGAGKTTIAGALGVLAAQHGLRTLVVEVGDRRELPALFGLAGPPVEGASAEGVATEGTSVDGISAGGLSAEGMSVGGTSAETGSAERERSETRAKTRAKTRAEPRAETLLQDNLWCASLDPDRALIEWLRRAGGRLSARILASSSTFQYFAAAAPGAKELVSLAKVHDLCEASGDYDLVVLDAPATGHALAMLAAPRTFAAIMRSGPLAAHGQRVRELLQDAHRSAYVAVAHATEMAVAETLDLEQGLRRELDRDLDAVVVNGTFPQRFTREELERLQRIQAEQTAERAVPARVAQRPDHRKRAAQRPEPTRAVEGPEPERAVLHAAVSSAITVHRRAHLQQSQIARLRRQRFAGGAPPDVLTVPFQFVPELDLAAIEAIARALARKL